LIPVALKTFRFFERTQVDKKLFAVSTFTD
jgi:hypothetical protein